MHSGAVSGMMFKRKIAMFLIIILMWTFCVMFVEEVRETVDIVMFGTVMLVMRKKSRKSEQLRCKSIVRSKLQQ